jgi:hypothetical protein
MQQLPLQGDFMSIAKASPLRVALATALFVAGSSVLLPLHAQTAPDNNSHSSAGLVLINGKIITVHAKDSGESRYFWDIRVFESRNDSMRHGMILGNAKSKQT